MSAAKNVIPLSSRLDAARARKDAAFDAEFFGWSSAFAVAIPSQWRIEFCGAS
jgi:hypothetical protein